ncbi:hypothetical protein SteCoe_23580 [Stentor coeruleus]|uniref:FGFR1 oncogene partner (FOP) N-terminal dimerisation domain-containing protein n=1 Tax=Stentor coeruleus TaxID=5963 RepID=A0A1R2BJK3_9CILI|nr:hypothetical protein SteCoe_23580 [Stentor coeruleus]
MSDLKNFLLENLERNGSLEVIKSELKSNLFNTLREDTPSKSQTGVESEKGELAAEIVRDFFETFCMQYSLSVFLPESKLPERPYQRDALEKKLGIKGIEDLPILSALLSSMKKGSDGIIGESILSSSFSGQNTEEFNVEKNK